VAKRKTHIADGEHLDRTMCGLVPHEHLLVSDGLGVEYAASDAEATCEKCIKAEKIRIAKSKSKELEASSGSPVSIVKSEPQADTDVRPPVESLKPGETRVFKRFVQLSAKIDKPISELLALAIEVRAIFAAKGRVLFEGEVYTSLEQLVEHKAFPVTGRTMRRWLAKEGLTDQRFANKPHKTPPALPSALPASAPEPQQIELHPEPAALPESTEPVSEPTPTEPVKPEPVSPDPEPLPAPAPEPEPESPKRFWLIPQEMYDQLNKEFGFDKDVCPYPLPPGYNSLTEEEWGRVNFCNPPFRRRDGFGFGPTAFVKKAIEQQKLGKTTVFTLPIYNCLNMLLEAGAEFRPAGRIRWLEVTTGEPWSGGVATVIAILRGKPAEEEIEEPSEEDLKPSGPLGNENLPPYNVTLHARSITSMQAQLKKLGITDAVVGKINLNPSRADRLDEAANMVENAKGMVEELRDELQQWLDGIPENMQGGQKASDLESAIEQLGEVVDSIDNMGTDWNVDFPSMMG
jgi:hypothetical protein